MSISLKRIAKSLIDKSVTFLWRTAVGRYLYSRIIESVMGRTQQVRYKGIDLCFSIPNALNKYRADSFSDKEPETLEWIEAMPKGSVLWDIGANVGLYSCYAAKQRDCRVFAFEPSVFNLELLARNIANNGVLSNVTMVPLPLCDALSVSTLKMTTTEWGGAMSTFGRNFGHDGEPIRKIFEFSTIGVSMVDAVSSLGIPQPDYIKMDVDGIEHLILKGGMPILAKTISILVEINDQFATQANDAASYLHEAGFRLKEKRHADCFDNDTSAARYTFNQIWVR